MDTSQLKALLKTLHWSEYHSSAYCALVASGPMKANDIAIRGGVPAPRIYQILVELVDKGWVKKSGKRPVTYDAQHPRYVIEFERGKLDEMANQAIKSVEEAWEFRVEGGSGQSEKAWIAKSLQGVVSEIRNQTSSVQKSLFIADPDISWMTRNDVETMSGMRRKGTEVTLFTTGAPSEILNDLQRAYVDVSRVKAISTPVYIMDSQRVLFRLNSPEMSITIADEGLASLMNNAVAEKLRAGSHK